MTIVVKLGGRVQSDPRLADVIASRWTASPGFMCIVHGGGDEISALQKQLGRDPSFVNGRRVTTEEDLELVRMVLSGSANKRLVSAFCAHGIPAVGLSGEDARLLSAEPIDPEKFGKAGKPVHSNVSVLQTLLADGFLPVISPVASDSTSDTGAALNVNGDDAAAAIAAALGAELWLVADVDGVLTDSGSVLPELDQDRMSSLVAGGTVSKGMHAKLEAGFAALSAGCPAVRVCSLDAFIDPEAGTFLTPTPSLT